jgi:hypothetical protein
MMTSLRLIEKVTKVNAADVTYGLLEKYNSEGKLIEYVVARNPVEKVGEFVNYTWDSGDYFSVAFVNPLEAKADAYDLLMCRAGYREEPNYRWANVELERAVSYENMETIARTAIDLVAQAEYDSGVAGLTDEYKEELADNLGINTDEAKEYFGLQVQRFKKIKVTATVTETYEFEIAVPESVTDWDYDSYVDNTDFRDVLEYGCVDYDYDYGVERMDNRYEAAEVG